MGKCKQMRKHKYTFTIKSSSWRCKYSMTRLQPCHQASCEEHGYTLEWASGQKPHLTKNGKIFLCKTKFLSCCCSRIVFKLKLEFVFQIDPVGFIKYLSESRKITMWRFSWSNIGRPRRSSGQHSSNETSIARSPTVVRGVHRHSKIQKCQHSQTRLMTQIRNVPWKWQSGSIVFVLTSQKTESAKSASEPRLQGSELAKAVPRAEKSGDLMTADHKVLNEGGESRNIHRYAVVVHDLAARWIQSYLCKTKTSQETERNLLMFFEPPEKPKVIHSDNSLEFGNFCEDLSWNHCASTRHRSETNGTAETAYAEKKEGRLRYCCNQVWIMNGGLIHGMLLLSAKCSTPLRRWDNTSWKTIRRTMKRPGHSVWCNGWVSSNFCKTSQGFTNLVRKFCLEFSSDMHCSRSEFGKEMSWLQTLRSWEFWTRQRSMLEGEMQKEVIAPKRCDKFSFPIADGTAKLCGRDHGMESENPHWGGTDLYGVKISEKTFREIRRSLNQ